MEKTDDVIIESVTGHEDLDKLIIESGGWDRFCEEWEVEVAPEGEEWLAAFIKDGIAYRFRGQQCIIDYDHEWYHANN